MNLHWVHDALAARYFSGFAHWHPLLAGFDFYWRMEPDVQYLCDLSYDPFLYMQVKLHIH